MQHSLLEYIQLGGYVMYILVGLNVLSLSLILWKFIQLSMENKNASKTVDRLLSEVISSTHGDKNLSELENKIYNKISKYLLTSENGMNTIKIIATIAPILGLLGTVIGVLEAFETIAAAGFSQGVNSFASGISLALITTVGGLIVALPAFIGYNYLTGSMTKLETKFEALVVDRIANEKAS